jgi:transposase
MKRKTSCGRINNLLQEVFMSGKQGMKQYSKALKEEAIRLFYEEGQSRRQVAAQLGVADEDRIKKWVQIYRREGIEGLTLKPHGRPRVKEQPNNTEKRIRYLEMENDLLRNFLYEVGRR